MGERERDAVEAKQHLREEEALDDQWVDPQVSFGPGAQSELAPIRFYPKAAA